MFIKNKQEKTETAIDKTFNVYVGEPHQEITKGHKFNKAFLGQYDYGTGFVERKYSGNELEKINAENEDIKKGLLKKMEEMGSDEELLFTMIDEKVKDSSFKSDTCLVLFPWYRTVRTRIHEVPADSETGFLGGYEGNRTFMYQVIEYTKESK